MLYKLYNFLRKFLYSRSLEKSKSLILQEACKQRISQGTTHHYNDNFESSHQLMKYYKFDSSIIDKAIQELEHEGKVTINNNDSPISFTLTDSTFSYLSEHQHPIKTWIFSNIFEILSFILGLWGAITGALALFLNKNN